MNAKRRIPAIVFILIVAIVNYSRIDGIENIRTIEFVSILTIGILCGILLREIAQLVKNKWFV